MTTIPFTIVHFDDEPDQVDWIPELFYNSYFLSYPDQMNNHAYNSEVIDENEMLFTFSMTVDQKKVIMIKYHLFANEYNLKKKIADLSPNLLFLDMMQADKSNCLTIVGKELYELGRQVVNKDNIHVITAFKHYLRDSNPEILAQIPDNHILTKPLNTDKLFRIFQNCLQEFLSKDEPKPTI